MENEDQVDKNKVMLSREIKDLIDMVSRSKNSLSLVSMGDNSSLSEAEELKKAWFRHLLVSLEKLNDTIENIRREDLPETKKELKLDLNKLEHDLKIELTKTETAFKAEITKIENKHKEEMDKVVKAAEKADERFIKSNETLDKYKSEVIVPLNEKVTVIVTKMSLIGMLAGAVGSIIFLIIKELLKL
jgi:Rad3-related DNA helicase